MSGAILLAMRDATQDRASAFRTAFGDRDVFVLGEAYDPASVEYAVVWNPPGGLLRSLPNLRAMFSLGAGVDHVLAQGDLPDVPLVRYVDPDLSGRMAEWVVQHCLMHLRSQRVLDRQQREGVWSEIAAPAAHEVRVGILGFGTIGQVCAKALVALGFQVAGWSRTRKHLEAVESFAEDERAAFLARTDMLVNLLPATPETEGVLNAGLIEELATDGPFGAPVLMNAGRGASQNEPDMLAALRDGRLHGASLDVFRVEPLPEDHPFRGMENVYVTPHMAAVSDPAAFVSSVKRQIERFEGGEALEHVVDRTRGY